MNFEVSKNISGLKRVLGVTRFQSKDQNQAIFNLRVTENYNTNSDLHGKSPSCVFEKDTLTYKDSYSTKQIPVSQFSEGNSALKVKDYQLPP